MMILRHTMTVFVPSTIGTRHATEVEIDGVKDAVIAMLVAEFGGCQELTPIAGYWQSATGETVKETNYPVRSAFAEYNADIDTLAAKIAAYVKDAMIQEAVAIEIDGVLYIHE